MAIADNKIKLNMITADNSNGDISIDHYYYYYSMYLYLKAPTCELINSLFSQFRLVLLVVLKSLTAAVR